MEESCEYDDMFGQHGLVFDISVTVSSPQGGLDNLALFGAYHRKRGNEILKQTHLGRRFGGGVFG